MINTMQETQKENLDCEIVLIDVSSRDNLLKMVFKNGIAGVLYVATAFVEKILCPLHRHNI